MGVLGIVKGRGPTESRGDFGWDVGKECFRVGDGRGHVPCAAPAAFIPRGCGSRVCAGRAVRIRGAHTHLSAQRLDCAWAHALVVLGRLLGMCPPCRACQVLAVCALSLLRVYLCSAVAGLVLVWDAGATGEGLSSIPAGLCHSSLAVMASYLLLTDPEGIQAPPHCGGKEEQTGLDSCSTGTVACGPRSQGNAQLYAFALESLSGETTPPVSVICFVNNSNSDDLPSGYTWHNMYRL